MTQFTNYLKTEFHYTNYQIGQLRYLYEVILSEVSKLVIMGIFFACLNQFRCYCFAVIVLLSLRTSMGGLHFKKYSSCFLFTLGFFFTAIVLLPFWQISRMPQLLLLLCCIGVNHYIGPVVSSQRRTPTQALVNKSRQNSFIVVFIYMVITFIFPSSRYITVGFWVIILQTLQLVVACLQKIRKEESTL